MKTEKTIIAITKTEGSGARTVADQLVSLYGYTLYSVRDYLRKEYRRLNKKVSINQEQLKLLGNTIRKEQGVDAVVAPILKNILREKASMLIIESLLCPAEIDYLIVQCALHGITLIIIGIDAPVEMRFERLKKRAAVKGIKKLEKLRETDRALYYAERSSIYIPAIIQQVVETEAFEQLAPEKEIFKTNIPKCLGYVPKGALFQSLDGKADETAKKIHEYVMAT